MIAPPSLDAPCMSPTPIATRSRCVLGKVDISASVPLASRMATTSELADSPRSGSSNEPECQVQMLSMWLQNKFRSTILTPPRCGANVHTSIGMPGMSALNAAGSHPVFLGILATTDSSSISSPSNSWRRAALAALTLCGAHEDPFVPCVCLLVLLLFALVAHFLVAIIMPTTRCQRLD